MEALSEMSPIDKETVQLLMHNLAINLANQQLREQHSLLLDQYRSLVNKHIQPEPPESPQQSNAVQIKSEDNKTSMHESFGFR